MKKWADWNKCWIVGRYNSDLLFVETEQKSFCLKCGQMVNVWGATFKITNNGLLEKGVCFDCGNKIRSYRKYHFISRLKINPLHWGRAKSATMPSFTPIKHFYFRSRYGLPLNHTPKYREIKRVMVLQPYEVDMMNDTTKVTELLMKCDNESSLNYWRNNLTEDGRRFRMPQMDRCKNPVQTWPRQPNAHTLSSWLTGASR